MVTKQDFHDCPTAKGFTMRKKGTVRTSEHDGQAPSGRQPVAINLPLQDWQMLIDVLQSYAAKDDMVWAILAQIKCELLTLGVNLP